MKRIFSLILVLMAVQMMFAAPYTVTNTSDDVEEEGSLRWACNQASSNKSVEITFDIEGDGNKVIKLTNQIQIQGNVTIDASSSKDSIIIDANDMEYSDYCFYINNYNSAKLNLKGLVLKNRKTSAIYLSLFDYYENTLDVLVDSCFFYGNITVYGGNLLIKNSYLNYSVIASVSESSSLEIVDCEFVNSQSLNVYLTKEPAKFVCSRTTFSRENITEKNPITYDSETLYSTPVIDTAYVKNGKLFVNGHIVSEEIVDIEIFSAIGSYNPNSSIHNRYECTKYIGATKTNSKGVFSLELTMPEKGLMLKQHFVLSASATYAKAHTSSIAFYDVKQPYWVVNTTLDEKKGSDFIVGTMRWACNYASANDTIVFDFSGKGTKEIEGFNYSTNASVDGSTYADTIILHGLHCLNVNRIVSENVVDGNGFSIAGGKMTNCISRNNKTGVEIYIAGISVENCIIEKNSAFGIHGYNSFNKIKHTIIRNNNIGVSSNNGGQCIEECDIINNIIGINSTGHPSILDSVVSCWISGNDSVGMYGSRIIYGNNIGLDKDQKTSMPNGYGIITSDYTDIIKYNIVAGNTRCGILTSQESSLDTISENFIGTNRNLDINPILGNGEDGIRGADGDLGYLPSISNCYFMNNHGSGLNAFLEGTVSSCVFSNNSVNGAIFTDFNGLSRFKQCSFSDNKKGGLALLGQSDIIDIDSCEFSRNGGYGLSISQINLNLNNSTFDSNQKEAIVNDNARSLLSNNKFLNTVRPYPAFKTTNPYPVPEFTSCKMTKTTIVIEGKIDTAAKAKIELFYTSQGEQTAEMLVDSFYTNPDGTFSDTLDRSMFVGKSVISFNATATYGKITSPLSDLVSPSLGRVDLASTEFYVKMDGYGDGSSWENAMNLQTFIYYLPQVMNGSTFYVAEGRYVPTSKGFKINSSVSIVGGFSPDATSGAVADPVKYKTVFTGDPSGDDYVVEDQYLSDPSNDDVIFSEFDGPLFSAGNFDVHISGCELSGTRSSINRVPAISCGNLYLTNCTFEKTGIINGLDKKKVVADGCIFRNLIKGYTASGLFE